MSVTFYSISSCPYCQQEEEYLLEKGINHTKIILDQQPEKLAEFRQVNGGFSLVPLTVVVKDDGTGSAVTGFNIDALNGVLGLLNQQPDANNATAEFDTQPEVPAPEPTKTTIASQGGLSEAAA